MSIVTTAELREAMSIGAMYSDPELQDVIDSAELLILKMLVSNQYLIEFAELTANVARVTTTAPHRFVVGQTITTTMGHPFNGSNEITAVTEFTISWAKTHADVPRYRVFPFQKVGVEQDYSDNPAIHQACLMTATDIWQSHYSANGQAVSLDGTPSPYRMGQSLMARVRGLIGVWIDTRNLAG